MVAKIQERRYNVATAFLLVVRKIGCIAVRCWNTGRRFLYFISFKSKFFACLIVCIESIYCDFNRICCV